VLQDNTPVQQSSFTKSKALYFTSHKRPQNHRKKKTHTHTQKNNERLKNGKVKKRKAISIEWEINLIGLTGMTIIGLLPLCLTGAPLR
jgi:hypothetical protein